jgi:CBS domain containing-hemolysin-like protein
VEKWLKPGRNQFRIDYRSGEAYEPDFVVETDTKMLILEVKARNELDDVTVKAKAAAATKWCRTATAFAQGGAGKPWVYALIPDDQIIGIVHAKDLLMAMVNQKVVSIRALMRAPYFVPENKNLQQLLREMRVRRAQMAIIQDEFGGTSGIVTIEDIVEELVGDIVDEYDQEEPAIQPTPDGWIVDARTHWEDLNRAIGSDFESDEFDTIGGYVFGNFGRQPGAGETIDVDGWRFTVNATDGRRITRLMLQPVEESEESESPMESVA